MIEDPSDLRRGRQGRHNGLRHVTQHAQTTSAIRQIAVQIDETDASEVRLALACHLARACEAALVGVGVQPEVVFQAGGAPSGFLPSDLLTRPLASPSRGVGRAATPDVMALLERRFAETTRSKGCQEVEWCVIGHGSAPEMIRYAKLADLTILGQQQTGMAARVPGFSPDDVALASGRPALIVPAEGTFEAVGANVAVAWDGSREAVRALADALPLLRDASSVLVMEVGDRRRQGGPEMPGPDDAVTFLARHGVQAFGEFIEPADGSVIEILRRRIVSAGIDLLVCGLFHHTRTRERLMGGVTHELFGAMTVPVLVSH